MNEISILKDGYLRISLAKERNVGMSPTLVERPNSTRFISFIAWKAYKLVSMVMLQFLPARRGGANLGSVDQKHRTRAWARPADTNAAPKSFSDLFPLQFNYERRHCHLIQTYKSV